MKPKNRKRKSARATLLEILNFYPISETQAFNLAQVDRRTWARWKAGKTNPPPPVVELIRIHALGELPHPAWQGFRIIGGLLYDPSGYCYTPEDVRSLEILRQHSARYFGMLRAEDMRNRAKGNPAAPVLQLVKNG